MAAGDLALNILLTANASSAMGVIGSMGQAIGMLASNPMAAAGVAATAAGAAMVGFGIKSVQAAGQFQGGMTSLVTGAGESASALGMVSQGILKMSVDTATSTDQLTSGMYMIESAGYHGAAGLQVLQTAAQGAKVGNADLGVTANALTTILTDYHLKASDATGAMNALITTVASGKTHLQDLAGSMGSVLPLASSLGISFPQVAGAIATMTNAGMDAQRASMNLANTIRSLAAPNSAATKSMQAVGLSAQQLHDTLTHQGLAAAIQEVSDAVGKKFPAGSVEAVEAFKKIMGGATGYNVALMLGGKNMAAYEANIKKISGAMNAGGNAVQGWSMIQGDFNFKLAQAQQALNVLMIVIGTALLPIVGQFMSGLASVVLWLINLITTANPLTSVLGTVAHFLSTNVVAVNMIHGALIGFGVFIAAVLIPLLGALAVSVWGVIVPVLIAAAPFIAIGAAIGLVVGALIWAYQNIAVFRQWVDNLVSTLKIWWDWLETKIIASLQSLNKWIQNYIVPALQDFWNWVNNRVVLALKIWWDWLETKVIISLQSLNRWIQDSVIPAIQAMWQIIQNSLISALQSWWNWTEQYVNAALQALAKWIQGTVIPAIQQMWDWVENKIILALQDWYNWLEQKVNVALQDLSNWINNQVLAALQQFWQTIQNKIIPALSSWWNWLEQKVILALQDLQALLQGKVLAALQAFWQEIQNHIIPALQSWWQWTSQKMMDALQAMWDSIENKGIPALQDFSQEILNNVIPALQQMLKSIQNDIDALQQFWQALENKSTPAIKSFGVSIQSQGVPAFLALGQNILSKVIPALQQFWQWIQSNVVPALQQMWQWIQSNILPALQQFWQAFQSRILPTLQNVQKGIQDVVGVLQNLRDFILSIVQAIQKWDQQTGVISTTFHALQVAGTQLWQFLQQQMKPVWDQLVTTWKTQVKPAIDQLSDAINNELMPALQHLLELFTHISGQKANMDAFWTGVKAGILGVITVVTGLLAFLIGFISMFLQGLIRTLGGIVQFFSGIGVAIAGIVTYICDFTTGRWTRLWHDWQVIWGGIGLMFQGIWNIIAGIFMMSFGAILAGIAAFIANVEILFNNLSNTLVGHSIIPDMCNAIVAWFAGLPGRVLGPIQSLVTMVTSNLGRLPSVAMSAGQGLMSGLMGGINSMMGSLGNTMNNVVNFIGSFLPHSPAKQGELSHLNDYGPNLVKGIAQGITNSAPMLHNSMASLLAPVGNAFSVSGSSGSFALATPSSASNQPQTVNMQILLDGREITNVVGQRMAREMRIQGGIRNV